MASRNVSGAAALRDVPGQASRVSRVVWKFGGTSIGDADRLRAVARRLAAARRQGLQVVAVLSAMGGTTDELVRQAYRLSGRPRPRELDALLSVGEMMSCALAAIAVHELGEPAVSLTGAQAGIVTDGSHGNARLSRVSPTRVIEELDAGAVVIVAGFQGVSGAGDVTTLGRGGSDATAIALASALGVGECEIFTDVPGVFTADPRVVTGARKLPVVSHEEMLRLAGAGARVMQARAVELAADHGVDIHVRSAFTAEPGTWIRRRPASGRNTVTGIAHIAGDGLGSVSVVTATESDQPEVAATARSALATGGIFSHLVSRMPGRVTCHVPANAVGAAAQLLHDAFQLHLGPVNTGCCDRSSECAGRDRSCSSNAAFTNALAS